MSKKIRYTLLFVIFMIGILITLTACKDSDSSSVSKEVNEFQNAKFIVWDKDTGLTRKEAFSKVMKDVKYTDYEENDTTFIEVTGIEKSTGNKIEMTWKKWSDGYDIEMMKVDGNVNHSYYEIYLFGEYR